MSGGAGSERGVRPSSYHRACHQKRNDKTKLSRMDMSFSQCLNSNRIVTNFKIGTGWIMYTLLIKFNLYTIFIILNF